MGRKARSWIGRDAGRCPPASRRWSPSCCWSSVPSSAARSAATAELRSSLGARAQLGADARQRAAGARLRPPARAALVLFRAAQARSDRVRGQLSALVVVAPLFFAVATVLNAAATNDAASPVRRRRRQAAGITVHRREKGLPRRTEGPWSEGVRRRIRRRHAGRGAAGMTEDEGRRRGGRQRDRRSLPRGRRDRLRHRRPPRPRGRAHLRRPLGDAGRPALAASGARSAWPSASPPCSASSSSCDLVHLYRPAADRPGPRRPPARLGGRRSDPLAHARARKPRRNSSPTRADGRRRSARAARRRAPQAQAARVASRLRPLA